MQQLQQLMMLAALGGAVLGGYYFDQGANYQAERASQPLGPYAYYDQPAFDVTFGGEVIPVWRDAE